MDNLLINQKDEEKMAGKQKQLMDIIGLLQHFRAGDSDREISRVLNIHRKTVRKYRQWATQYQLLEMEKLPPPETIQHWLDVAFGQKRPAHMVSTVEPYRQEVIQWRSEGLTQKAIWLRLEKRGYPGSYGAVSRFIGRLEKEQKLANQVTVRWSGHQEMKLRLTLAMPVSWWMKPQARSAAPGCLS